MIEGIFSYLSNALSGSFSIALFAAFSWGVLSILLSPCHLASIPLVIGYISSQGHIRVKRSFYLALLFAVGILVTIAVIGLITASMGRLMGDIGVWGNWLVAAVFIIIGLYLMDIIRWDWTGINLGRPQGSGFGGAFILGLIFGAGLGPCTFAFMAPVLGVVFTVAADSWIKGVLLIMSFGLGHCAVITAAGSLTNWVQNHLNWLEHSRIGINLKKLAGVFVILGGIYLVYITIRSS